jgi:tetratricopeptide (TPR) repeat protein
MMRKGQLLIYIFLIAFITGCALVVKKPLEKIVEVPGERFVKAYLRKGREHEDKGDLVAASKQYKLAMIVIPRNKDAIEGYNRVEIKLRSSAQEHYKAGLKFHKQGKYGPAHHQFLIALRLWPDYPEVIERLASRKRIQIKGYIVHTIKKGENLSKLADMYYGDSHKFQIIAKYNNLTDATQVYAGQKIKVPEIEGMGFLVDKKKTEELEIADSGLWDREEYVLEEQEYEETLEPEVKEEEEKPGDHVAIYRDHGIDLFRKREYQEAIAEFAKVLSVYPEDSMALEYAFKSYFQQGVALFEKKDYLAAKDRFESCLLYKSDCHRCRMYIKKSKNLYNEMHYKTGIQFFAREQLVEAIEEWELVRDIDSNYKRVDYLINKAEKILEKVEELKESQEERNKIF